MKFKKINKSIIENFINNVLDKFYKEFRVEYIYIFFVVLSVMLGIYHIIKFIVSLPFYSYISFIILGLIVSMIAYIISKKYYVKPYQKLSESVGKYGVFYFMIGIIALFLANMFTYSMDNYYNYFLYSLIIFLFYYLALKKLGFSHDYNIISNNIKSDDIMVFYTVFIYIFLFFYSYFVSLGYVKISKEILILLGFFVFSLVYIYFFHIYNKIDVRAYLYSNKYFKLSYNRGIQIALVVVCVGFLTGFYILNKDQAEQNITDSVIVDNNQEIPNTLDNLVIVDVSNKLKNNTEENTQNEENIEDNGATEIITDKIGNLYDFERLLGIGDAGEDVANIQKILLGEGYYNGELDGIYDEELGAIIKQFITDKIGTEGNYSQLGPKTMEKFKNIEITVN